MSDFLSIFYSFKKVNYKDLFFPVLIDFLNMNREIDKKMISKNNWDLINDESNHDFIDVITKIELHKKNNNENKSENEVVIL